ncbi:MAG: hypothetical protein LBH98_07300 [Chitinispirillales bacterium]|jgi:hypothetical protein|nr:hypothetical protein [Chitinispirillales bacterium]
MALCKNCGKQLDEDNFCDVCKTFQTFRKEIPIKKILSKILSEIIIWVVVIVVAIHVSLFAFGIHVNVFNLSKFKWDFSNSEGRIVTFLQTYVEYYEDGQIATEMRFYKDGNGNIIPHGQSKAYYGNGKLKQITNFKDGEIVEHKYYAPDGRRLLSPLQ